ncbi:hypothetical protein D9758_004271 [Tetrapyrgos nigripes]|uniref:Thioesterase domain-containing protein n=1 Tax=Tetrapyrgos nigripes TaxID=182062 RepID=A0A8H5GTX0_9AGAR|nr:hypothetical protein D9758_004271 [Tetrapyrgos nigripes]
MESGWNMERLLLSGRTMLRVQIKAVSKSGVLMSIKISEGTEPKSGELGGIRLPCAKNPTAIHHPSQQIPLCILMPTPKLRQLERDSQSSTSLERPSNSNTTISSTDISRIAGNASHTIKQLFADPVEYFNVYAKGLLNHGFAETVVARIVMTEVSILDDPEEKERKRARVVCRMVVEEDMVNGIRSIHGGCSALLVDLCSGQATAALGIYLGLGHVLTVSQSLSVVYHAPAYLGEVIRIVSTSVAVGSQVETGRTEIWSETHHRLVASGLHIKMVPSSVTEKKFQAKL